MVVNFLKCLKSTGNCAEWTGWSNYLTKQCQTTDVSTSTNKKVLMICSPCRMVVFVPRTESCNAILPPSIFHTWPMTKRQSISWLIRMWGLLWQWPRLAYIAFVQCFNLIKYQMLLTLKQYWWSYGRKWQGLRLGFFETRNGSIIGVAVWK